MPSLKAPVVVIVAPAALVSAFPLVFPSIAAPRLLPPPPPPVSDSVPAFVMVLLVSTLRRGNGTIVECTALTDAPGATLMVTPVLPVAAMTRVVVAPEQLTVVPLVGAVLLHWAAPNDGKAASKNTDATALTVRLAIAPSTTFAQFSRQPTADLFDSLPELARQRGKSRADGKRKIGRERRTCSTLSHRAGLTRVLENSLRPLSGLSSSGYPTARAAQGLRERRRAAFHRRLMAANPFGAIPEPAQPFLPPIVARPPRLHYKYRISSMPSADQIGPTAIYFSLGCAAQ